jgi:hypothetical protein
VICPLAGDHPLHYHGPARNKVRNSENGGDRGVQTVLDYGSNNNKCSVTSILGGRNSVLIESGNASARSLSVAVHIVVALLSQFVPCCRAYLAGVRVIIRPCEIGRIFPVS